MTPPGAWRALGGQRVVRRARPAATHALDGPAAARSPPAAPCCNHGRSSLLVQVNVPKTKKAFCKGKECRKHTMHKVTQYKTGKASLYAQGARRSGGDGGEERVWPQQGCAPC